MAGMMKAAIIVEPGRNVLDDKPIPQVGTLDALIRITTPTICGTDVQILKGEYPVAHGLVVGHEPGHSRTCSTTDPAFSVCRAYRATYECFLKATNRKRSRRSICMLIAPREPSGR